MVTDEEDKKMSESYIESLGREPKEDIITKVDRKDFCVVCGSENLAIRKDKFSFYIPIVGGIDIEQECKECSECGETYFNSKQMKELSKNICVKIRQKTEQVEMIRKALGYCIQHKVFDAYALNRMHEIIVNLNKEDISKHNVRKVVVR